MQLIYANKIMNMKWNNIFSSVWYWVKWKDGIKTFIAYIFTMGRISTCDIRSNAVGLNWKANTWNRYHKEASMGM